VKSIHHIELWVPDLEQARRSWGWILTRLGWSVDQIWGDGTSWRSGEVYIVVTQPPASNGEAHDRHRPGVNHLALWAGSTSALDLLVEAAPMHGWTPLYAERYPHAGGAQHYAAYLESEAGFKLELVANDGVAVGGR